MWRSFTPCSSRTRRWRRSPGGIWRTARGRGRPRGLIRADLTPKPAYSRLLGLVKGEWWTKAEVKTDAAGTAHFRGFLGHYRLTIVTPTGAVTQEVELAKGQADTVRITLK